MGKKPIVVMLHIKKEQRRLQKHLMQEGIPPGPSAMYAALNNGRYPMHSIPGPVGAMEGPSSRHGPVGPMVGPLREQMYLQQQSLLGMGGDRLDVRGSGMSYNRSGQGLRATMGHNGGGGYNNHHLGLENSCRGGGGYGRGNGGSGLINDMHHNHNYNSGSYRMGAVGGGGGVHGMGVNHTMGGRGQGTSSSSTSLYGNNNNNNNNNINSPSR